MGNDRSLHEISVKYSMRSFDSFWLYFDISEILLCVCKSIVQIFIVRIFSNKSLDFWKRIIDTEVSRVCLSIGIQTSKQNPNYICPIKVVHMRLYYLCIKLQRLVSRNLKIFARVRVVFKSPFVFYWCQYWRNMGE